MENNHPACIYCDQSDRTVPLLLFKYQGREYWICPQHLPILIHHPEQLAHKLPGLELLRPSEGHS
jgi:hypothetical protein